MQLSESKLLEIRKEAIECSKEFKDDITSGAWLHGYVAGAIAEALKILPIYEAAKELIHLHGCDQEALQPPTPKQWIEAVEGLTNAILAYDKNENFVPKYIVVEQERDELITQRKNLQDYYIKIIDRQTKEWIEISDERDRYREALEKILDIQESDLYLNKKPVQLIFEINQIIGEALSTHSPR